MTDQALDIDKLLPHLPEGVTVTLIADKSGRTVAHIECTRWQSNVIALPGPLDQLAESIIVNAWGEQTTYETKQAIKRQNEDYKVQLAELSKQNKAAVKQLSDNHHAKKAAAIEKAHAAYKAKKGNA